MCMSETRVKIRERGAIFNVTNLDSLALNVKKLKCKGMVWFGNVQGVKSLVSKGTRKNRRGGSSDKERDVGLC